MFNLKELKEQLKLRGLKYSGTKAELVISQQNVNFFIILILYHKEYI